TEKSWVLDIPTRIRDKILILKKRTKKDPIQSFTIQQADWIKTKKDTIASIDPDVRRYDPKGQTNN
ncbi:13829_t:CDS:2, partial [Gigaspora rosea]